VWAEKQVNSFTDWINYTFAQAQVISKPSDSSNVQRDSDSCVNTMHDETDTTAYGLNDLMQRRAEAKLRQEGVNLLHHSNLAVVIKSIEGEVVEGRLTVRSDRDVHADLGLQEGLLEILFCYEYQWLRLGLEVVFGQVISIPMSKASTTKMAAMKRRSTIPCVSGCSKWKAALKSFIQDYLLSDTDIATKQFDKQKLLYAAQERKMKELLRRHLLKKFFALVFFLDTARTTELMAKACLFQSTAEYKSSHEVIAAFCRLFLKGEGDITRHLMSIGCKLHFVQSYVDEFDYRLSRMTTELRDGVRLVKLMDLLTKSRDLCQQLRVPAVSRLQKLHNVSLVLNRLYRPTDPRPDAKQIVDGHRDMTLMLLWKILYTYELCNNTNPTRIYDEIAAIKRAASWRRSIYKMEESKTMAVKVSTLQGDGTIINEPKLGKSNAKLSVNEHVVDSAADDISLAGALLQWCQAIVKRYDVPVNDLTTCMADGRALCLVVHYYHPAILPIRLIRKTSANIIDEEDNESIASSSNSSSSSRTLSNELQLRGLQGERRNYWTLRKACNGIGGIPVVLPEFDSRNIPDEKSMIVFLGYLFSRLVESSCQVRAAIRIQRAIRLYLQKYELYTNAEELEMNNINPVEYCHEKTADDSALMQNVNKDEAILKRKEIIAFRKLQQVKVSIKMCSNQAATVIQRKMRSYVVRKKYLADRQSTDTGSSPSECIDDDRIMESMVDSEECNNDDIIEIARDEVFNIIDLTISSIAAKDLKEAKDRSLQSERRFALLSELQSSFSSKCIMKNLHNQVLQELETSRLYQAIVISSEDDKKHALANAVMAEEERIAREKAEFRVEEEMAMRVAMEWRLIEMETLRQQEHEVALRADEEKKKREEELLIAQERLEAERLKRDEIERLREISEAESRRMLEEATDVERQARKLAEERMEKEIMARLALEARLNAIEEAAIAIEIERLRVIEEERLMAANRLDAAITLQFYWREYAAYMKKHKIFNGISQLQARYRGHLVRKQMRCSQLAVSIIQALWRRKQCSKELQHRSLKTIQIQACWRGYAIRKTQKMASKASTSIARFWKTIQQRHRFVSIRKAVISIQSFLRRIVVQREYQTKRRSIIQLQSCFRKYQALKLFASKVMSALIIQKSWRRAMVLRACQAKHSDSRRQELLQKIRAKMLHRVLKTFVNRVSMKLRQQLAASKLVRWYLSRRPLMFVRKLLNGFRRLQVQYSICISVICLVDDDDNDNDDDNLM
jgi:abnormal spindle-like microcephaly-associated protein